MFFPRKRVFEIAIALLLGGVVPLCGYSLIGGHWPQGSHIVMQLQLGATNVVLQDGLGTWNGSAANALVLWNQHLQRVRFGWVNNSTAPKGAHNGKNNVSFAQSVYGEEFGSDTLAVTVWWTSSPDSILTEADVLFNNAFHFNSYRGPLQNNVPDFHRVALHEFGHVLGLDHPDEVGQDISAIMNSEISNLDHLAADDIAGANYLYGYKITSPLGLPSILKGDLFNYQITADNNPTSFDATGLPPGVVINRSNGHIAGHPTVVRGYAVVLTAHGPPGDASAILYLDVRAPFLTSPGGASDIEVGDDVSFQVSAEGNPTHFSATGLPPGFRINPQTGLITGRITLAGDYAMMVTATSPSAGTASGPLYFLVTSPPPQQAKKFSFAVNRILNDSVRKRVYATLPESNSVAVIDAANLSLIKMIPVQGEPKGMAMAADGKKLFVARTGTDDPTIEVVDLNTLTRIQGLPVPSPTYDLEVGLSGRLFATTWSYGAPADIFQIDSATGQLLAPFPNSVPFGLLEISPDRKTLYVAATGFTPPSLVAMDVSSDTPVIREEAPRNTIQAVLADFKLSHNGQSLWPAEYNSRTLLKLSGGDLRQNTGHISLRTDTRTTGPIALSPYDDTIFVTSDPIYSATNDTIGIDVWSVANSRYLRRIQSGVFRPSDMLVDSSGRFLFAGSWDFRKMRIYLTGLPVAPAVTPHPKSLLNVSTRLKTQLGDDVLIGGFIISGSEPKKVAIRAMGPSLPVSGKLADPIVELYNQAGTRIASNDSWNAQRTAVMLTGIPPADEHEAFIIANLQPGNYTTILRGVNSTSGVALVEIYDLSSDTDSKLANISTRGKVETGDNVMIGGFIVGGNQPTKVIIRAIGPSLTNAGVQGALRDPVLELHNRNGTLIFQNDNWRSTQLHDIVATRIPPEDVHEAAIVATLNPGNYTAIVRGKNNTTGVALVEIYNLEN